MCEAMQRIEALGMAKGMAKGEAKGRAEGMAKGEAKGKRENMLETARRMLESGMLALKDIARFSGLSLAQVKKLQLEMA